MCGGEPARLNGQGIIIGKFGQRVRREGQCANYLGQFAAQLIATVASLGISAALDVTNHQIVEQGPQIVLEQYPFERIGGELFRFLSEELIKQATEPLHICRLVPIRSASPNEKLNPVSAFNAWDRRPASSRRKSTGADRRGGEDPIPKLMRIGVEERQGLGRT